MKNPQSVGEYHPEADDLTCSETDIELGGYLEKHPNRGMPFGFPPLQQEEFEIIAGWLAQGARDLMRRNSLHLPLRQTPTLRRSNNGKLFLTVRIPSMP